MPYRCHAVCLEIVEIRQNAALSFDVDTGVCTNAFTLTTKHVDTEISPPYIAYKEGPTEMTEDAGRDACCLHVESLVASD